MSDTLNDSELINARRSLRRANFRLKSNEYRAALETYNEALEYLPQSVEILNNIASLNYKLGNREEALRYYRDAISIEENDDALENLGFVLLNMKKYEEALDIFNRVSSPKARIGKTIVKIKLGKLSDIPSDEFASIEQDPNTSKVVAEYYHKIGKHNQAIKYLRGEREDWKAKHFIGVQYFLTGARENAHSYFKKALEDFTEQHPDASLADNDQYFTLYHDMVVTIEDYDEKHNELKFLKEKREDYRVYRALAVLYYYSNQEEFIKVLDKAIDLCDDEALIEEMKKWRKEKENEHEGR